MNTASFLRPEIKDTLGVCTTSLEYKKLLMTQTVHLLSASRLSQHAFASTNGNNKHLGCSLFIKSYEPEFYVEELRVSDD
jgi:hypothetical protein